LINQQVGGKGILKRTWKDLSDHISLHVSIFISETLSHNQLTSCPVHFTSEWDITSCSFSAVNILILCHTLLHSRVGTHPNVQHDIFCIVGHQVVAAAAVAVAAALYLVMLLLA